MLEQNFGPAAHDHEGLLKPKSALELPSQLSQLGSESSSQPHFPLQASQPSNAQPTLPSPMAQPQLLAPSQLLQIQGFQQRQALPPGGFSQQLFLAPPSGSANDLREDQVVQVLSFLSKGEAELKAFREEVVKGRLRNKIAAKQRMSSIMDSLAEMPFVLRTDEGNEDQLFLQAKVFKGFDVSAPISLFNGMKQPNVTEEMSEQYEKMPLKFRSLVTKSHCALEELMKMYNEIVRMDKKDLSKNLRCNNFHFAYIFGYIPGIVCPYCYSVRSTDNKLKDHMKKYHLKPQVASRKCPYLMTIREYCPVGCSFMTENRSEMRQHLILYHSEQELKNWGISRNYLKFIERRIEIKELKQLNRVDEEQILHDISHRKSFAMSPHVECPY